MVSVAIDGPSGAGKSTLSKMAAKNLGFIYVDTGALYRAVGLKFLKSNIDENLNCNIYDILNKTSIDIKFVHGEQHVFLDGTDVSDEIRTPMAAKMASVVSAQKSVREYLLDMQRKFSDSNNIIMDGRDIGTVVLPNATVKIYLTASAEARAKRRFKELSEKKTKIDYITVLNNMKERDYNDSHREIAPLKKADDAILVDTTNLDFDESLNLILKIIKENL